jgi:hypothetical protein
VNTTPYGGDQGSEEIAKWKNAIDQLLQANFIERESNGEVYVLNKRGIEAAKRIQAIAT